MSPTKSLTFSTPFVICYTAVLLISFIMTIAFGIWMNDCVEKLNYSMANNLKMAHLASGIAFICLALFHGWCNRSYVIKMFTDPNETWHKLAYMRVLPFFLLAFVCVVVSAIMILCNNKEAVAFHCGVGLLFAVLAVFHITLNLSSRPCKQQ